MYDQSADWSDKLLDQIAVWASSRAAPSAMSTRLRCASVSVCNRKIGWPCAPQNPVDIKRGPAKQIGNVWAIGQKCARFREQPTKFELFVNMRTAHAIGLTIPGSIQLRADKLIE
jgi:hypothetical protein